MSVVIIGGNERMEYKYREICKRYNCKSKIYTKMASGLKEQIGRPDMIILFTSTVSHKMVRCAISEAEKNNVLVERCHSSSSSALKKILDKHCLNCPLRLS